MISLALRNIGCVYDKDDKCIGKFIVNSAGFNVGSMPKYFYVIDGNYVDRLWISSDDVQDIDVNQDSAKNLPDNIYILMDICDGTNVSMLGSGIAWCDEPRVIGNLSYFYSKISDGVYALC